MSGDDDDIGLRYNVDGVALDWRMTFKLRFCFHFQFSFPKSVLRSCLLFVACFQCCFYSLVLWLWWLWGACFPVRVCLGCFCALWGYWLVVVVGALCCVLWLLLYGGVIVIVLFPFDYQ